MTAVKDSDSKRAYRKPVESILLIYRKGKINIRKDDTRKKEKSDKT